MGNKKDVNTEEVEFEDSGLVKGVDIDLEEQATKIVADGVASGKAEDELKQSIFSLGVPFSKLNMLYKAILKKEGLAVDVKALKSTISDMIEKSEFTFNETLEELKEYAKTVVENVPHATITHVMSQLKAHWRLNEMEFPRKAAPTRGKMGAINKAVINAFKENPKTTVKELEVALESVTSKPENRAKSIHTLAYALANGLSALEVLTVVAKEKESK